MARRARWGLAISGGVAATLVVAAPASAAIFRVGSGFGCTHSSIQAAVNAAAASPGMDFVRITRSRTYPDQRVTISSQDLQLEGGFAGCLSASADGTPTTVSGAGTQRGSVFSVSGAGTVVFADLDIVSGDPTGDGGGIAIANAFRGNTHVFLAHVRVLENAATNGGGISVVGQARDPGAVRLELGPDSIVQSNRATKDGGGIFCRDATVDVTGSRSRVVVNQADRGGGIHAEGCRTTVTSEGFFPHWGAVALNTATRDGGGLSILGNGSRTRVFTVDGKKPAAINYNTAGRYGGGAYLLDSHLEVLEGIVEGNEAPEGGGVYLAQHAVFPTVGMVLFGPAAPELGVARCDQALRCNRISDNRARTGDGGDGDGAAIMARIRFGGMQTTVAYTRLAGTLLTGNSGKSLLYTDAQWFAPEVGNAIHDLDIIAAVITGNRASGTLIDHFTHLTDHHALTIRSTSIGGNQIGDFAIATSQPMQVRNSIIWQPDNWATFTDNGHLYPSDVRYTIMSDRLQLIPYPDLLVADPEFRDVAAGDLRLRDTSPGIDYAPDSGGGLTRDGRPRPVDLPLYSNRYGPEDAGAFERQIDGSGVLDPD